MRPPSDLLGVAERLLELLGEGQYVATYKYAVVLGLLDLVLELPDGQDPTAHQLAEKVIQLYWPHTAPYGAGEAAAMLRQNVYRSGHQRSRLASNCRGRRIRIEGTPGIAWIPHAPRVR